MDKVTDDETLFVVFEEIEKEKGRLMKQLSFKEKQITVIFKRAPLGFSIGKSADHDDHFPIVIAVESGSEADKLGVKAGFELVQADAQELMNWDAEDVEELLDKWVSTIGAKAGILGAREDDQLYLVFENKKAPLTRMKSIKTNETTVAFTKRPLGFSYKPATPIIVTAVEPGSEADENGVKVGMKVVQIDGQPILSFDFDKVESLLKKVSKKLDPDVMSKDERMWVKLKETSAAKAKMDDWAPAVDSRLDDHAITHSTTKAELDVTSARVRELEQRLAELEAKFDPANQPSWFSSMCLWR